MQLGVSLSNCVVSMRNGTDRLRGADEGTYPTYKVRQNKGWLDITAESDLTDATERLGQVPRRRSVKIAVWAQSGHNRAVASDTRRQVADSTYAGVVKLADTRDLKSLGG